MKKVIILVMSSKTYPSYITQFFQKLTWVKDTEYPTIFYFGGSNKPQIKKRNLYLPVSTKRDAMGRKTIEAFKYIKENYDFDYILRTNTSSYIDYECLKNTIETIETPNYCGAVIGQLNNSSFISGAAYILEKSVVDIVIENEDTWDHSVVDDIAISKLLQKNNITFSNLERNDVTLFPTATSLNYSLFHTRCRLDTFKISRIFEGFFMTKIYINYKIYRHVPNVKDSFIDKFFSFFFKSIRFLYIPKFK
tara:strand:- start:739 stop:1488 length:750 start_codon:yes stop_codon:yes gene_type:complete